MIGPDTIRDELNEQIERVRTIRVATGGVDLFGLFKLVVVIGIMLAMSYWLGGCQRDQIWRDRIAAQSAAVKAKIAKANGTLEDLDREIVSTLGEQDEKLRAAEQALSNLPEHAVDGCMPLPRRCYGLRQ